MTKKEREEKKKLFLDAMRESRGLICTAIRAAGISKQTLYNWKANDKAFSDEIDAIKDETKEWVQGRLLTLIENGSAVATMFYLKTQCGWRETQKLEVEHADAIDVKAALEEIKSELQKSDE